MDQKRVAVLAQALPDYEILPLVLGTTFVCLAAIEGDLRPVHQQRSAWLKLTLHADDGAETEPHMAKVLLLTKPEPLPSMLSQLTISMAQFYVCNAGRMMGCAPASGATDADCICSLAAATSAGRCNSQHSVAPNGIPYCSNVRLSSSSA
eukprot:SAG31_NODE_1883_length_6996_cov_8.247499_3_plen_150_part_00